MIIRIIFALDADSTGEDAVKRGTEEAEKLDFEIETDIRSDWKDRDPIPVDDEQLVDWSSSEETMSGSSLDRPKRS
ncbi:MAG: hypothetical protein HC863_00590 [Myxococcales bacterium]|nr:hypothetical protein [Myxococcales bacterium]